MAESPEAALGRIRDTPVGGLSVAEYVSLARAVRGHGGLVPVRPVVLATWTTAVLEPFLRVEGARLGLGIDPHFGGFGQLEQELLGDAWRSGNEVPELLVVALRLEDLRPDLVPRYHGDPTAFDTLADDVLARVETVIDLFRQGSSGAVLVANFAPPRPRPLGPFDANDATSLTHRVQELNRALLARLRSRAGCHVWDYAGLVESAGSSTWTDPRLWALGRIPVAAGHQPTLARHLMRSVRALVRPAAKCLVVDLDGVLWGGVVGDDGVGGIVLGDDHPGSAYKAFQRAILGLRDRGILLAISSKNDREVVTEALTRHPEMLVKPEDFAAMRIDWGPKSRNLLAIAEELNIGADSLVFFDDNPVERAEVAAGAPQVIVVPTPTDPIRYVEALAETAAFDAPALTDEDRTRAASYQAGAERRQAEAGAGSLEDFLESLDMELVIGELDAATAPRVSQLVAKTNQFNLATRRQTQPELEGAAEDERGGVWWARLSDRYGDMGLVAVGVLTAEEDSAVIHNLILSCRAANRGIEQALVAYLAQAARERGFSTLVGEYVPTPRNHVVERLYPSLGFSEDGARDEARRFRLALDEQNLDFPEHIHVRTNAS